MTWLEKMRGKPEAEKIQIIRLVVIIAAVLLIVIWVISSKFGKDTPKDTSLFQTIGRGFHDIKQSFKK